jgi:hypothetical protein
MTRQRFGIVELNIIRSHYEAMCKGEGYTPMAFGPWERLMVACRDSGIPVQRLPYVILATLPTLLQNGTADLKVDGFDGEIWLHRTGKEDGEPFKHTASIRYFNGSTQVYDADFDNVKVIARMKGETLTIKSDFLTVQTQEFPRLNANGLTLERWIDSVGGPSKLEGIDAEQAWKDGDDPADYR